MAGVQVSVMLDLHGVLHCTCAAGKARIGCPHLDRARLPVATPRQGAAALGRSRHRSKNGGERNGRAKPTADQVSEIRLLGLSGRVRGAELAQRFGVSEAAISDVITGRHWLAAV